MAIAGTLEIQMFTNIARFTDDMAKVRSQVTGAMSHVESAVGLARDALATLGIGMGIHYFADLIKGSIEAMDHLHNLSLTTTITVETLSGLALAAKQSGSNLDDIGASINKLAVNMGKDGEKFKALGITAKDPLEAFKQLADVFVSVQDPQLRAALGAAALGKAWAGAAPLLSQGGRHIGEMVTRGMELSNITGEMAGKAHEFNDRLAEFNAVTEGAKNRIVGGLLPAFTQMITAIVKAYEEGGKLAALIETLGQAGRFAIYGEYASDVQKLTSKIKSLNAEFEMLAALRAQPDSLFDRLVGTSAKIDTKINAVTAAMAELRAQRTLLTDADKKAQDVSKQWEKYYADEAKAGAKAAAAKVDAFLHVDKATKETTDGMKMYETEMATLTKRIAELNGVGLIEAYVLKLNGEAYAKLEPWQKASLIAKEKELLALEAEKKMLTEIHRLHTEALNLQLEEINVRDQLLNGLEDDIKQLKIEHDTLGMTEKQRAVYLLGLEKEMMLKNALTDKDVDYINKLGDEGKTLIEGNEIIKQQISMWDSLGNTFGNFMLSFRHGWHGGMDFAKQELASLASQMFAFFAKRWLLNIAAAGTFGSTAAGAATSVLGNMGSSVFGSGMNSLGGTAASYLFGTSGTAASSTIGIAAAEQATGTYATTGLVSSGGVGQALVAAMPYLAIAAAVFGVWKYLSSKSGGPKTSGSAMYDVNNAGDTSAGAMTDSRRFYYADDKSMDAIVGPIMEATAKSYATLAKKYGGVDNAQFLQSTDTDPHGTASNRVATQAYINGIKIFEQKNENLGRDAAAAASEMQLQAGRALLGALQASKLRDDIAKIIDSVAAANATQAQLTDIFLRVAAMDELFGNLAVTLNSTSAPIKNAIELLQEQGTALADFAKASDRSAQSLTTLTIDTAKFRASVTALIQQYEDTKITVGTSISDAIRNLTFGTLDKAGQYGMLQSEAQAMRGSLGGMTDAAMIANTVSQIVALSGQAFGLLDPAAQQAQLNSFIVGLKSTQEAADTRLADLQHAAVNAANLALAETRANLDMERTTAVMNADTATMNRQTAVINQGTAARGVTVNVGQGITSQSGT